MNLENDIVDISAKYQMTIDRLEALREQLRKGEWVEGWSVDKVDEEIKRLEKARDAHVQTIREVAAELGIDV